MRLTITLVGAIVIAIGTASCDNALDVTGSGGVFQGRWEGSASFTTTGFNAPCNWIGRLSDPPAVTLDLNHSGDTVTGTVRINIPDQYVVDLDPTDGWVCSDFGGLNGQTSNIDFISITPADLLTFRDPFSTPGNIWKLTRSGDTIRGNVSNPDASPGAGLQTLPGTQISLGRPF